MVLFRSNEQAKYG